MSSGPGRRAGSPDTRNEVLEAARLEFAELGFDKATMRSIAARAGVDPSLIHHYFGNKDGLFAATLELQFPPGALIEAISGDPDHIGRRLAEGFFLVWEHEASRTALLGILRSAFVGEDRALEAFRQFMTGAIQRGLASQIDTDDAELRAVLMASHLVGVAMTRYVVGFEPIASASVDEIVDLVAPRIQSYVES